MDISDEKTYLVVADARPAKIIFEAHRKAFSDEKQPEAIDGTLFDVRLAGPYKENLNVTDYTIMSIEYKDMTGQRLIIKGICRADFKTERGSRKPTTEYTFKMTYDLITRKGKIWFKWR